MNGSRIILVSALAVAATAAAQGPIHTGPIVGPERLVAAGVPATPGPWVNYTEVAVAARKTNINELAVAFHRQQQGQNHQIVYAVSTDGATTFTPPQTLPPLAAGNCGATTFSIDPSVAAASDGTLWVGGVEAEGSFRVIVSPIPAGLTTATATYAAADSSSCIPWDKPWVAVGPRPSGAETMYVTYNGPEVSGVPRPLLNSRCDDNAPLGTSWSDAPRVMSAPQALFPIQGVSTAPVIVPVDPNRGRLVVPFSFRLGSVGWTRSDTEGVAGLWTEAEFFSMDANNELILNLPGIVSPGYHPIAFPSAAVSADGQTIVAEFTARHEPTGGIDLYVAVSRNRGQTFERLDIFRLDDSQLRVPGEDPLLTIQSQPAVALDQDGGVNLLFVNARGPDVTDDATFVTIRYARFASVNHLTQPASFVRDLTPRFPTTNRYPIGTGRNEYHGLVHAGCVLYAAYPRTDPAAGPDGVASVYAVKIAVGDCGVADVDGDAAVTSNDAVAFASAYISAAPEADVNLDQVINSGDLAAFTTAYSAVTGGTP